MNQGPSGCQEGNAVEVSSAPFDGTHPDTKTVMLSNIGLNNWQKSGVVINGDVDVNLSNSNIGPSATQLSLAANSVQVGFGATAKVNNNKIAGNSWCCSSAAATGVLLFSSGPGTQISRNDIDGNADVGIYVFTDGATVDKNKVYESGADGFYDIGIGDYGIGNVFEKNKVAGYGTPYDGVVGDKNKVKVFGPE
ncbi:MAG: right-handed parallel beta-helix repeat-containing protein [bacterium]|nr:right-handed parallel beta-helix repeat-containing protein [bacterium]